MRRPCQSSGRRQRRHPACKRVSAQREHTLDLGSQRETRDQRLSVRYRSVCWRGSDVSGYHCRSAIRLLSVTGRLISLYLTKAHSRRSLPSDQQAWVHRSVDAPVYLPRGSSSTAFESPTWQTALPRHRNMLKALLSILSVTAIMAVTASASPCQRTLRRPNLRTDDASIRA